MPTSNVNSGLQRVLDDLQIGRARGEALVKGLAAIERGLFGEDLGDLIGVEKCCEPVGQRVIQSGVRVAGI